MFSSPAAHTAAGPCAGMGVACSWCYAPTAVSTSPFPGAPDDRGPDASPRVKVQTPEEMPLNADQFASTGNGKGRGGLKKAAVNKYKVDETSSTGKTDEQKLLEPFKRRRDKGLETRKLIKASMQEDRVCGMLGEKEIDTIID